MSEAVTVRHSGKNATFCIGGPGSGSGFVAELPVVSFDIDPKQKLEEFKDSRSGGYVLREGTFFDSTVTANFNYDFANPPFETPISMVTGAVFTNIFLYLHQTVQGNYDGPYWTFSSLIVESAPTKVVIDGKVAWNVVLKGNGAWTAPTT